MFTAFNFQELHKFTSFVNSGINAASYRSRGKEIFDNHKRVISSSIEKYYIENKKDLLDANKIMEEWFPQIDSHVFISHSHADVEAVFGLVGFLKIEFGIESFIDSAIWGYADDLLRKIDDDHCFNEPSKTYIYEKRNITTSNVYLMLLNSLQTMVDNTECVIFVETPNSVKKISEQIKDKTYSPWIFSELNIVEKIRRKLPIRKDETMFEKRASTSMPIQESVNVVYDISKQLAALNILTMDILHDWKKQKVQNTPYVAEKNLDKLYLIKGWVNSE